MGKLLVPLEWAKNRSSTALLERDRIVENRIEFDLDGRVIGKVSDGYHSFDELYEHRMALMAPLMKAYPELSWRSKQHAVGGEPMFKGFFVVGMNLPNGQVSYHYKLQYWDIFHGIREVSHAPKWDGHTPEDVVERLIEFSKI